MCVRHMIICASFHRLIYRKTLYVIRYLPYIFPLYFCQQNYLEDRSVIRSIFYCLQLRSRKQFYRIAEMFYRLICLLPFLRFFFFFFFSRVILLPRDCDRDYQLCSAQFLHVCNTGYASQALSHVSTTLC